MRVIQKKAGRIVGLLIVLHGANGGRKERIAALEREDRECLAAAVSDPSSTFAGTADFTIFSHRDAAKRESVPLVWKSQRGRL